MNSRIILIGRKDKLVSARNIVATDGTKIKLEVARDGKSADLINADTDAVLASVTAPSLSRIKRAIKNECIANQSCVFANDNKVRPV